MKDIDKISSNELRAEVRVLRPVYEAARVIDDIGVDASGDDWDELAKAIAAVEAQDD